MSQQIIISNRFKAIIFIILALVLAGFGVEESLTDAERAQLAKLMPSQPTW